ncbi:MAG TPA: hypothetical protein VMD47_10420 [Candidatus Acidoferrales bacterium]|nr:hypothetical protein [Candidatus Acidoferrales bacterium]
MGGPGFGGYFEPMDEELTLHEIERLEALRKLRSLPEAIVETAWVRDAQVEAVIDAVLVVALHGDLRATAHARHAGEWCARIAGRLPDGPDPLLARRVGVLGEVDPVTLEQIPELRHLASHLRRRDLIARIAEVAREFDTRIMPDERGRCVSPRLALRAMLANADERSRPIVEALETAVCSHSHARVA